ncbi:NB5R4 reductase, partial [Atractosteus spatula]|nr:NB5R4 reductase [Atractosteus spatula]
MLNVPSQSFPAASSQQRVSSSGRSKVPLKPGRSLMDWIRLAKSGKDLTGLRGKLIDVTEEELASHNKRDDCWICIRGLVYNVSAYMEYHPGGEQELMRAAGADGTDLFDQVHRWVNYESMLKECLVGRMAVKPSTGSKDSSSAKGQKQPVIGVPIVEEPEPSSKDITPRYDWFQTDTTITIVVYTKQKDLTSECVVADFIDGALRLEVVLGELSYLMHLRLSQDVSQEHISIQTSSGVGKVEVSMNKVSSHKWQELGAPLDSHNSLLKQNVSGIFFRKCTLVSKTPVTHDTKLLRFQLPHGTRFMVPVGNHVYLKSLVKGSEIIKPYTPVLMTLMPEHQDSTACKDTDIFLMIKIYPDGAFSSYIESLQIGATLYISNPEGQFRTSRIQDITDLYLLAAGTGFTPMAKLIRYALKNLAALRKIKLIFFNRRERDILWLDQLQHLALEDKRFEVEYVLSEPSAEWKGKRGRIETPLLSNVISRTNNSKCFVCVCGPTRFTEQALGMLQQLGYCEEEIHAFQG